MPSLRKSIADKLLLIQVRKLHSVTKGLKTPSFKISREMFGHPTAVCFRRQQANVHRLNSFISIFDYIW